MSDWEYWKGGKHSDLLAFWHINCSVFGADVHTLEICIKMYFEIIGFLTKWYLSYLQMYVTYEIKRT